ncbi:MAG: hypothetical protein B1H04_05030 [Planctomycetales bacterium 4484_123]|nr:MAG: hypothetical protein B1H04_05030 [Planctomycetales bacterium 4484_123]
MTAWRTLLISALLALWQVGCTGPEKVASTPPQAVEEVDDILVLADPVAANWDGQAGADGLDVGVLLFRRDRKLPVTVKGTLEMRLYEGVVRAEDLPQARPLRTWRFDAAQLRALLGRTPAGWGYALRLPWGPTRPATSSVTLTARYVAPSGRTVHAPPVAIATRPR